MVVKVGFSRGTSLIAPWICRITGHDISHSFFLVDGPDGQWAYEAVLGGFRKVEWARYQRGNTVKALVDVPWPHDRVRAVLERMLGTPYPMLGFAALALGWLIWRNPHRVRWLFGKAVDCVTATVRVLREFGHDMTEPLGPGQLRDYLKARFS